MINKELRTFDRNAMNKYSVLVKATSTLNDLYLDGKVKNISLEINKLSKYINDLRNDVEHRDDIIKEMKF